MATKSQPDRSARPEFKRIVRQLSDFANAPAVLNAIEKTAADPDSLESALADAKRWLRENKLVPPARSKVTLEQRPSPVARSITVCITVCGSINGYTACVTVCVSVRFLSAAT